MVMLFQCTRAQIIQVPSTAFFESRIRYRNQLEFRIKIWDVQQLHIGREYIISERVTDDCNNYNNFIWCNTLPFSIWKWQNELLRIKQNINSQFHSPIFLFFLYIKIYLGQNWWKSLTPNSPNHALLGVSHKIKLYFFFTFRFQNL